MGAHSWTDRQKRKAVGCMFLGVLHTEHVQCGLGDLIGGTLHLRVDLSSGDRSHCSRPATRQFILFPDALGAGSHIDDNLLLAFTK